MNKSLKDLASDEDVHAFEHIKIVINIKEYPDFYNVEEEKILKAWFNQKKSMPSEDNDYEPILMRAQFFDRHGLSPLYYVDPETNRVFVTSEEFLDGKFN